MPIWQLDTQLVKQHHLAHLITSPFLKQPSLVLSIPPACFPPSLQLLCLSLAYWFFFITLLSRIKPSPTESHRHTVTVTQSLCLTEVSQRLIQSHKKHKVIATVKDTNPSQDPQAHYQAWDSAYLSLPRGCTFQPHPQVRVWAQVGPSPSSVATRSGLCSLGQSQAVSADGWLKGCISNPYNYSCNSNCNLSVPGEPFSEFIVLSPCLHWTPVPAL